jgi:hypothetical protein
MRRLEERCKGQVRGGMLHSDEGPQSRLHMTHASHTGSGQQRSITRLSLCWLLLIR